MTLMNNSTVECNVYKTISNATMVSRKLFQAAYMLQTDCEITMHTGIHSVISCDDEWYSKVQSFFKKTKGQWRKTHVQ